jgi:tagaturonate epimerase
MSLAAYNGEVYPRSVVEHDGVTYFLGRTPGGERQLGIVGRADGFGGTANAQGLLVGPCSAENAATLRARLPWLTPQALGTQTSFGFGDRIGMATPGHIQALRATGTDGQIAPIFGQQSVRENARTGRTPQAVLDDALWGIFQEGWRAPWGADADHVKEIADLAPFVAAGYTFYTIDPSDYVDNAAQHDSPATLREKVAGLPWSELGTTYAELRGRYCREPFALGGLDLAFDEAILLRAERSGNRRSMADGATVLGEGAQRGGRAYDLEMSVDETDTPTSAYEHFFIANELLARDIPVASLAPRFVGKFQKGVDYMGDADEFEAELMQHVALMRHFGCYKISVHTGSDKFSIYPIIARHTHGRVHVKTAGTSYLEALRLVAALDPGSFRLMLDDAREHFEHDRKSYFLDAMLEKVPAGTDLADAALPSLLDQFDARQVLHVAFGTLLTTYGEPIRAVLAAHEADYRAGLERHFARHLVPFAAP